jgi:hypothetical protein
MEMSIKGLSWESETWSEHNATVEAHADRVGPIIGDLEGHPIWFDAVGKAGTVVGKEGRSWIRNQSRGSVIESFHQGVSEEVEKSTARRSTLRLPLHLLVHLGLQIVDDDRHGGARDQERR